MKHSWTAIGALVFAAACSTSGGGGDSGGGGGGDGGTIANECVTYCDGMYSCVIGQSSCMWTGTRSTFDTNCRAACASAASTMTETQVTEAVDCLHCLDQNVVQDTCGGTNMLADAVTTCGSTCATVGVMTINNRMLATFLAPDAGAYTCMDAGTP